MKQGRADEVKIYINGILGSQLPISLKLEILSASNAQGSSGLALAMKKGKFEVVDAFFDCIINSDLNDGSKKDLLIGDLLFYALLQGHSQAVTAYINGILRLNLGKSDRKRVLFASSSQGERPGLRYAMENGHSQAVKAYIEGISKDPELIHELLEAGVLGLALLKGWHQAIAAYAQAVLALGLDSVHIKRLFTAKSTLVIALKEGYYQAIVVYIEAVCTSGLDQNDIKTLLSTVGLAAALEKGRVNAMKAYIQGVLNSGLSEGDKKDILMTPGLRGELGVYLALKKNDYLTVKAYIRCILASNLLDKSKQSLRAMECKARGE
ncbi:hypothetical protein ACR9PT_08105 [Piscirickettsia salmonis]|uniref:hypothetical protein n=1 Tax=Piscirickettsia salmonis TaxID=1238 RepID=UPI003EBEC10C